MWSGVWEGTHSHQAIRGAGNRRQDSESWPLPAPPLHTQVDCGLLCSQGRQLVLFLPLAYPENPCDFCGDQPLCSFRA